MELVNINDAIQECKNWINYIDRQKEKTTKLQRAASLARSGKVQEAKSMKNEIDSQPIVYDGARLYPAIKLILNIVDVKK